MTTPGDAVVPHASCVAVGGGAALIVGPSGAGKSRLALEMIALGAMLVADDRVVLTRRGETLVAAPPAPLRGLIEARGVGLLQTDFAESAAVRLVVDLGAVEPERLPPFRSRAVEGVELPLLLCKDMPGVAAALIVLLRSGGARRAP